MKTTFTAIFERVEKKYLLTPAQYAGLMRTLPEYMQQDQYGESTVCSLYFDTRDSLLIRRSTQKPPYKEKLRLRSYGVPGDNDPVFVEIKKKVGGVVYKRRVCLPAGEAMRCLREGRMPLSAGQIGSEIGYMLERYQLAPAVYLAYDRTAYAEIAPTPDALRITIDRNIRSRESALDLRLGDEGTPLLEGGMRLMEIKTARAIPLWLCRTLSRYEIRPASFSKYGRVYETRMRRMPTSVQVMEWEGGAARAVCRV